jgi:hypothetical protein
MLSTLGAALRAALEVLLVDVRGRELEVDIRVRAQDVPDVLIWTEVDEPLLENAAALGGSPKVNRLLRADSSCARQRQRLHATRGQRAAARGIRLDRV